MAPDEPVSDVMMTDPTRALANEGVHPETRESAVVIVPRVADLLSSLQDLVNEYSGSSANELVSSETWCAKLKAQVSGWAVQVPDSLLLAAVIRRLTGKAKQLVCMASCTTMDSALSTLCNKFPKREFQGVLIDRIKTGQVFRDCTREDIMLRLGMVYDELYMQDAALAEIVRAVRVLFLTLRAYISIRPNMATAEDVSGMLSIIGDKLDADEELHPVLFGEAKPKSAIRPIPSAPAAATVETKIVPDAGPSRSQRRRHRARAKHSELMARLKEFESQAGKQNKDTSDSKGGKAMAVQAGKV
ncbi:hypothetical protein H4S08_004533 [Coemansia sp. RSA 1365]|nr:hypothetical protein H4S08_004533 [Coemansia sp. RSA 1365]